MPEKIEQIKKLRKDYGSTVVGEVRPRSRMNPSKQGVWEVNNSKLTLAGHT